MVGTPQGDISVIAMPWDALLAGGRELKFSIIFNRILTLRREMRGRTGSHRSVWHRRMEVFSIPSITMRLEDRAFPMQCVFIGPDGEMRFIGPFRSRWL